MKADGTFKTLLLISTRRSPLPPALLLPLPSFLLLHWCLMCLYEVAGGSTPHFAPQVLLHGVVPV